MKNLRKRRNRESNSQKLKPRRPTRRSARLRGARIYQHTELEHDNEIRLLKIMAGKDSEMVEGVIFHARLDNHPAYEALSYTWGAEEKPEKVSIGVLGTMPVTSNCLEAIKRLRYPDRDRVVWIDAVCIDQSKTSERNHQVGMMPHIYQNAVRVMVYLGDSSQDSDLAMEYLETYAFINDPPSSLTPISAAHSAFFSLLGRPWFSRIWIIQEVFMAKSIKVLCGGRSISWNCFRRFGKWTVQDFSIKVPRVLFIGSYRQTTSLSGREFFKLLCDTRDCGCKNPRDRIFALLSMGPRDIRESLTVDYNTSTEALFTNTAMWLTYRFGIDALSAVSGSIRNKSLPTWVPDWRVPSESTPITDLVGSRHEPIVESHQFVVFPTSPGRTVLRIRGVAIAEIGQISDILSPSRDNWCNVFRESWLTFKSRYSFPEMVGKSADDETNSYPLGIYDYFWAKVETQERQGHDQMSKRLKNGRVYPENSLEKQVMFFKLLCMDKKKESTWYGNLDGKWYFERDYHSTHTPPDPWTTMQDDLSQEAFPFQKRKRLYSCCNGRRIFFTDKYPGLGPAETQPGDVVYMLERGQYPFVLRKVVDHFELVGTCFVLGAMDESRRWGRLESLDIW